MSAPSAIGFRAGVAAAAATVAYDVVQILQVIGVLHFPVDEILVFGTSLCITVPFLLEVLALHHSRTADVAHVAATALARGRVFPRNVLPPAATARLAWAITARVHTTPRAGALRRRCEPKDRPWPNERCRWTHMTYIDRYCDSRSRRSHAGTPYVQPNCRCGCGRISIHILLNAVRRARRPESRRERHALP